MGICITKSDRVQVYFCITHLQVRFTGQKRQLFTEDARVTIAVVLGVKVLAPCWFPSRYTQLLHATTHQ